MLLTSVINQGELGKVLTKLVTFQELIKGHSYILRNTDLPCPCDRMPDPLIHNLRVDFCL